MNSSKKVISFVTILLVAIATVLGVIALLNKITNVRWILSMIAMIPSFIYACNGYKKDVAVYYKTFMGLYALDALIALVSDIINTAAISNASYISTIFSFIVLIDFLILAFAKDFGKQKSMIVVFCILGARLVNFVRMLAGFRNVKEIVLLTSFNLIVSIVACLFVYAKYQDKAERGAK